MPTLRVDQARNGSFYTSRMPGMVREPGYDASRSRGDVEILPDGSVNGWNFLFCKKYRTEAEAKVVVRRAQVGLLDIKKDDLSRYEPDVRSAEVIEIDFSITPITLSESEIAFGRARAVINSMPKDRRHGKNSSQHLSKFPTLPQLSVPTKSSEPATHAMIGYGSGYHSPLSTKAMEAFRAYLRSIQPEDRLDISNDAVSGFIGSCNYTRTDLNGLVEDFDPLDDDIWTAMKDVASTPLWVSSGYRIGQPLDVAGEDAIRKELEHSRLQAFEDFIDSFPVKERAILRASLNAGRE